MEGNRRKQLARWSAFILTILALLILLGQTGFAEQIQRHPILISSIHVRATVPLRDMKEVAVLNTMKVMPEHDEPVTAHQATFPDAVAQDITQAPPVGTQRRLYFSGITGSQGGGFLPPDRNS